MKELSLNLTKDNVEITEDIEKLKQANDVKTVTERPDYEGLSTKQELERKDSDFTEELTKERSNETTKLRTHPSTRKVILTTTKYSETDSLWTDEKFETLLSQGCDKLLELYQVRD